MLKKILNAFRTDAGTPLSSQSAPQSETILERADHNISRKLISKHALTVVYELNRAGFEAYLVGGCIRDLLLGRRPKDFDVATNATPEQVHALFRRSRIVGRRFKIVHVRLGREIIEVTTFRSSHANDQSSSASNGQQNAQGMLIRDNVYGSLREDALRRDFTVNAFYYSIDGFKVVDYTNGLEDLANKVIRIIGQPEQRYREDPVRMLRAIRFAAKLGFTIEPGTATPIFELNTLLSLTAPARLFDEVIKLFLGGNAVTTLELLLNYGLFSLLFPNSADLIENGQSSYYQLIIKALENTDQRVKQGQSVTPAFLFSSLLWPCFSEHLKKLETDGTPRWQAMQQAGYYAIDSQQNTVTIPRRFGIAIREIWGLQYNLESAKSKRAIALLSHPRFRAAYDFMLMRELSGESMNHRSEFWTKLQQDNAHLVNSSEKRQRKYYKNHKKKHYSKKQSTRHS